MNGIPRPLVRVNQAFILVFAVLALVTPVRHLLLLPLAVGIHALITRDNLLFRLARPFLRQPLDHYVMEDPDQQRFNQWIAVLCLGLSWLSFMVGLPVTGYVFGGMVAIASGLAICGFCIGCAIRYRWLMWKNQRSAGQ
jgi:hypothetical protein